MHRHQALVACVQGTKLGMNSSLKVFKDYATVRRDRPTGGGGGGLVTLVRHSVPYGVPDRGILPDDDTAEVLAVKTDRGGTTLRFDALLEDRGDQMVLGDFNAHHPSWFSRTRDDRAAAQSSLVESPT